jgi:type II secretory pathway pseudopilin PulG
MRRTSVRRDCVWMAVGQQGITLVEVLVALALTVTVVMVVTSVLLSSLLSQRRLLQQTDDYEALRVAAAIFTQDARYAHGCSAGWDYLHLTFSPSERVEYKFATRLPDDIAQLDPDHLHRWHYMGGSFQSDEIIGWNLVPPSYDAPLEGTRFECTTSDYNPNATIILLKPPLPGQQTPTLLRVFAYHRS